MKKVIYQACFGWGLSDAWGCTLETDADFVWAKAQPDLRKIEKLVFDEDGHFVRRELVF